MKKLVLAVLSSLMAGACITSLPEIPTLPEVQLPVVAEESATWNSADYAKKPILMVFMGSWCPYCKMTMPAVTEVAEEYGDKVEIVSVFMDDDPAKVAEVMKQHNFHVKALYDGGELAQAMSVNGLPHGILFDKKHRAIRHWEGFSPTRADDFKEALERITK